ncbi:HET-domain-containing protein [Lentinus brumalis]|uniref:HET-domain-containing protein n=1 Tax=Lentinus brumalis TaxID=2498619 RepID=A0A371DBQ0_9APHY|nr:HET-domain-containing protein [Polyporus brumalis]
MKTPTLASRYMLSPLSLAMICRVVRFTKAEGKNGYRPRLKGQRWSAPNSVAVCELSQVLKPTHVDELRDKGSTKVCMKALKGNLSLDGSLSPNIDDMRLLDTRTGEFVWVNDPTILRFAIISHVWSADGEQPYQDLLRVQDDIRDCCAYALADGFDFLWIDSCCIDKTSSAELSEAINSMYTWYSLSTVCYAFLQDVDSDEDPRLPLSAFRRSRWHTRGWTLQELIAPRVVVFVSATWRSLGTKGQLADVIEEVTGVDRGVLLHTTPLTSVTVARRMSWAARRVTTRKEDEAYSLMGIFGVNMPAIYGEGALAFGRLQEEILKQVPDQTIFVWDTGHSSLDADERRGPFGIVPCCVHPRGVLWLGAPAPCATQ